MGASLLALAKSIYYSVMFPDTDQFAMIFISNSMLAELVFRQLEPDSGKIATHFHRCCCQFEWQEAYFQKCKKVLHHFL